MLRRGAVMSILLWCLPFTMFSGACDFAFSMGQTQMAGDPEADAAERMDESDDTTFSSFGSG
jgi:hypothetical protein